jgi:hypothetical protein
LSIASNKYEIDGVSVAVFAAVAQDGVPFACRMKQFLAKELRVGWRHSENGREDASFMTSAWVSRI